MVKSSRFLIVLLIILGYAAMASAGEYSTAWQAYLADHAQDRMVGAIITMTDQVDLRALQDHLYAIHADRQVWHETVVRALQEKATSTQADILAELATLQAQGQVSHYKGLWVGNVIVMTGTSEAINQLVSRSDVERISPDYQIEGIKPVTQGPGIEPTISSVENGLLAIHADQCWGIGITGEGRLISSLDTGVDGTHPALADRWRGVADPRYAAHPEWAWYDPVTNTDFPFDAGQHGTHTMGTMCGLGVDTGDTVGVAFGAQWINAGVIDRVSIQRTVQDALTAFEWVADPDGDPSTVWDVPDVNSNSWGVMTSHGYPPCDETFWSVLDGVEAAGVVVCFAAGNEGPTTESLRRPADRATTDITSFSVGAVDGNDPDQPIADFSSRGPSHCTDDGSATFKPEVSAPGVNVRSSVPGGGYEGGWSGTSMATPHVSGVVALMRQANPSLSSEQVRQILMETAVDHGTPGEDNNYGMGVIDAYAAVQRAIALLNGWGTLGGIITDQGSGNPLAGARVTVLNRDPQLSAVSRSDGQFYLLAPADTAWQIKVEYPPNHLPVFDTVTFVENDTIYQNYALEGKVTVTLKASFGNPTDVDYRSFYLKGSWDPDGFYNAGWTGDAIGIKDDGIAPDQIAGDGVFTGAVMLARDMTNTYNWALYSENYGGEASRLQNGANFTIHDLTPPVVPTLSVNPSGSDHNWQITAAGDHGLNLDLSPNADNRPYKWAAAESLTVGTTYTFKFTVMHSNVASYGVGGVGGGDIVFTPDAVGSYVFKFDDRTDSYTIQLVGHPSPSNLIAISGQEFQIPLHWSLPNPDRTVMGTVTSMNANQIPVKYEPLDLSHKGDSSPINPPVLFGRGGPDSAGYSWVDSDEPDGPTYEWRDIQGQGTQIPLNDDDQTLGPFDIGFDFPFYGTNFSQFYVCTNGWISFTDGVNDYYNNMSLPNTATTPLNLIAPFWDDQNMSVGGECWFSSDGNECVISFIGIPHYTSGGPYTYQVVIRSSGTVLFEYQSMTDPLNLSTIGIQNGDGSIGLQVVYNADYVHDNLAIQLQNQPEGTPPAHFNLYRSTSSPVPIDPGHIITGNIPGTLTSYVDNSSVQNGVPYYYKLTAVWVDSVESVPSNEAVGTAANHPPEIPTNLAGIGIGRDINLTWSFTNLMHDIDHYNIYKKLVPGGTFTLAGSSSDTAATITIPAGQDGVYEIAVSAVDNGNPQLESGLSQSVLVTIGHLPPGNLVARSNFDSAIPLTWILPGSVGALGLGNGMIKPASLNTGKPGQPNEGLTTEKDGTHQPINPPVLYGSGGPDSAGYSWIDSDEPGGPAFEWRDITDRGTQIPLNADDQTLGPFDIGYDFSFYDNTFNQFYVCSNGWVSFTDGTNHYYNNQSLPNTANTPFNLLAPFWDDLTFSSGGQCWYYYDGSELVISFIDVPHLGTGGPYTFQVVLRSDGSILYEYQTMTARLNECTIGIQNGDGTIGLQVVYDADYVHDSMAIKLSAGTTGTPPVHYKLYRSTTSPVPVDPSHMITAAIPGELTAYLDSGSVVNGTTYYYVLTAVWPDSVESPASNEASGRAVLGARMTLNPPSIDVTGPAGQITTTNLNIANGGGLDLNWGIFAQSNRLMSIPGKHNSNPVLPIVSRNETVDKSNQPDDPTNPPMLLGRGGPDDFGYSWIDSDEPDGPSVNWVDITDRGQPLTMGDDDNQGPFNLGFDFPFYGTTFNTFNISSNGFMSFTSTLTDFSNDPLPSVIGPENLVAPFWDDMDPTSGGEIWFYSTVDSTVISWIAMPGYSGGGPYSYQIVLLSSGIIYFNYGDMGIDLTSATIGIQNSDRTIALQVAYNQDYIHNGMTVRIAAGWLSASPASGILAAGNNVNITVTCDATILQEGTYTGSLIATGFDLNHQLAPVTIPVTFHVTSVDNIGDDNSNLPTEFGLSQNYPNPFNPTTEINFALPTKSQVSIEIYNVLGQKIRTLVDGAMEAGYKSVTWNGMDQSGNPVTSGTYFYKLTAGDKVITKKMTMLK